ncbi:MULTISPECIES: hypothetical protein [unclassified Streptomyces]|uniref:hypothetical protein n=1 Tax=unclassified Streptomyces TaxID=2593676 RepID=UPI002DDC7DD7|nr:MULTISPECIES: hypothetical protein [unclassified Streptomyces]WSF82563.1 hypothetical protein OIE70_05215 [Streptomyces sp. NBC_01744]WSC41179.1 hypothetical protein OHA08_40100 [Streptomyces sp. NBC_01763]WSC49308.1 hypothetical protein OIE61_38360 [Streptomyces sp. NBC_01762]WSC51715.1 hypothetical protein OG808_05090 [Streptomyces sp. NBC_01761]WSD28972.1 hypothetical protein OHA26_39130 [Streptomyces sp. NBC_01751]
MGGFAEAVRERIREARARLKAALETEDAFEVAMAEDELEDALRMAHKYGISTGDEVSEQ